MAGFQQLRVTRKLDATGAAVLGIGNQMMPTGHEFGDKNRHYFVSEDWGSDTNDGKSWQNAFASFEKGIDMARFDAGSTSAIAADKGQRAFVFVAPGQYNETTQLLWSGYNISVIGCGTGVPGKDYGVSFNYDGTASSTAAFLLSGSGNEIYNFHVYCDAAIPALYIAGGDNNHIHNIVIECDGTNCTYGIQADSLKGSRIDGCYIDGAITAGIYVDGGADRYMINGHIRDCHIYSSTSNAYGIHVDNGLVCRNFPIDRNIIELSTGSSGIGIWVDATSSGYPTCTDNYVSVASSASPITHDGGDQYLMGNHTAAGTVNADPYPTAA